MEGLKCTEVQHPSALPEILPRLSSLSVIFLDLEMPEMDGYQALQLIRSQECLNGVPVVAYTVHNSEINTARLLGFHSFLGKPLDADRFPEQLTRILNGERVWVTSL
jgi:CheY-like chemotaxis protein